jgi:CDP-glucose 4,6-dehydratase
MNTYGPGDTNFSRIVPRAIQNLLHELPYDFGDRDDGNTRLQYLHVRDMASAYIKLAERLDLAAGDAFNFGSGVLISTRELTTLISRLFDGRERTPWFLGPPRDKPVIKHLDIRKAKRILDWQPTTSLEQGLVETIEWYRRFRGEL